MHSSVERQRLSQQSLTLNFFHAIVISTNAMTTIIHSSFIKNCTPTPSIIIFRTISIYHLAGIMSEIQRKTTGIFSMGNISPEKTKTGIISPIPETSNDDICLSTKVEISNPNDKATTINKTDPIFVFL